MIARLIILIILIGIFFIPGKWLWSYFKTKYDVNNASIAASNEIEDLAQSGLELSESLPESTLDLDGGKDKPDSQETIENPSKENNTNIASIEQRESRIPKPEEYSNRTLIPSLVTPSSKTEAKATQQTGSKPPIDLLPQKEKTQNTKQKPLAKTEPNSNTEITETPLEAKEEPLPNRPPDETYTVDVLPEKSVSEPNNENHSYDILQAAFNAYNELETEASSQIVSGGIEPENNLSAQISEAALNASKELQDEARAYFIAIQQESKSNSNVVVNEPGSTPAEYIMATIPSPADGIVYELNRIAPDICDEGRSLRVYWKVKNETASEIPLTASVKKQLSPTKLRIVDFKNNRRFSIRYDRDLPIANCNLAPSIKPYGRVECSALIGPIYETNDALNDPKVLVFMPGVKEGVRIFLNV